MCSAAAESAAASVRWSVGNTPSAPCAAQSSFLARLSTDTVEVGEVFDLLVRVPVPAGSVVHFPDTIRQLESLASAALVPQESVDVLVRAYQAYRLVAHRRSLEGLGGVVPAEDFAAEREAVAAIWRATMEEPV